MSAVVHASGCAPPLLYVLLYGLDTYTSRQLGQAPPATLALLALASLSRNQVTGCVASAGARLIWK